MGLRFTGQKDGTCFFITTSFNGRRAYGRMPGVYEALADSTTFYTEKYDARLPAYVFMPTHLHLLLLLNGDKLGAFMRDFKKYLAQKALNYNPMIDTPLWETGYDRQVVYTEDVFRIKLNYIHNNPVKAGLVVSPEDWPWSSAGAYLSDNPGPIHVWKEWLF